MSDPKHFLDWNGSPHPDGWSLRCDHGPDEFSSSGPNVPDECWVMATWEDFGLDLLTAAPSTKWPGVTPIPLEVRGACWHGDAELVPWMAD